MGEMSRLCPPCIRKREGSSLSNNQPYFLRTMSGEVACQGNSKRDLEDFVAAQEFSIWIKLVPLHNEYEFTMVTTRNEIQIKNFLVTISEDCVEWTKTRIRNCNFAESWMKIDSTGKLANRMRSASNPMFGEFLYFIGDIPLVVTFKKKKY